MIDIPSLFVLVILIAIALVSFKWFSEHTETFFWTSFILYFDPGGVFSGLSEMGLLSRLKSHDLFFVFMMLAWRASGYWKINTNFRIHRQYLFALLIYCLYFVFAYGYFVPLSYGYDDFPLFFQKNRQFIYCPFIFLAVYQFGYMSIDRLFKPLLYSALLMFVAYFITVLAGIELLPIYKWSRFIEDDRISLLSYGLSYWLLPFGLAATFLEYKLPNNYKRLVLISAAFMFVILILTLTRREFIRIIFMLIAIPALTGYISGNSVGKGYRRILLFMLIPFMFLLMFFPIYLDSSVTILENLFGFLNADDASKLNDYRFSGDGDLVYVKQIISDHPLLGIGYYPAPWAEVLDMKESGNILGLALDASSEVPIFGSTMRLGFVGLILPTFIHLSIIVLCIKIINLIKKSLPIYKSNIFELLLALTIIYYFITLFSTDLFSLFLEYYHPPKFALFTSMLAMLLAIYARLNFRLIKMKSP
jgi:hypothetical protein